MLTLKQIREDSQRAIERLAVKGIDATETIAKIIELDDRRKSIQAELDQQLARQNSIAKQIGQLMAQGKKEEATAAKESVAELKESSKKLDEQLHATLDEMNAAIGTLPNFPADIVPYGKTAADNLVVKLSDTYTKLHENPLSHGALARK